MAARRPAGELAALVGVDDFGPVGQRQLSNLGMQPRHVNLWPRSCETKEGTHTANGMTPPLSDLVNFPLPLSVLPRYTQAAERLKDFNPVSSNFRAAPDEPLKRAFEQRGRQARNPLLSDVIYENRMWRKI